MPWQTNLTWNNAKQRSQLIAAIRAFFANKQVIEVETPLLSQSTITDLHLDAFVSRYDFFADSPDNHFQKMYLQTSPEFAMKRLLASGYGCIFQISKAFRHESYGRHHNPEFTMLEWYRLGFDHFALMNEVAELLIQLLACKKPTQCTYQSLFIEYVGIDPLEADQKTLLKVIEKHQKTADWLIQTNDNDTLKQFIFSEIIENKIGLTAPCFVYNFPSSQASLAKISKEDPRVAERFECYYHGIELANGFNELTDANTQEQRFIKENNKRLKNGLSTKPIDSNFINALSHGLPQCAGVALGVDRLIMLALNEKHIEKVITFSINNA